MKQQQQRIKDARSPRSRSCRSRNSRAQHAERNSTPLLKLARRGACRYCRYCTTMCILYSTVTAAAVFIFSAACVISIALSRKKREKKKSRPSLFRLPSTSALSHMHRAARVECGTTVSRTSDMPCGEGGGTVWCLARKGSADKLLKRRPMINSALHPDSAAALERDQAHDRGMSCSLVRTERAQAVRRPVAAACRFGEALLSEIMPSAF